MGGGGGGGGRGGGVQKHFWNNCLPVKYIDSP